MKLLEEIQKIKSGKKELREFALTMGIVSGLIGSLQLWRGRPYAVFFLTASGIFFVFGFTSPQLLKPFQKAWMTFAVIVGWFMSRVILTVLFILLLTPFAVLSRLLGNRFLDLKFREDRNSSWLARPKDKKQNYEVQF